MELRQLEYFVAVAEEANFTRAAERVHISQSGVSAQIRRLEHELGAALFDRSGRRARLTGAGAATLGHARAALAAEAAMRQAVADVTGLLRGRLVAGMVTACGVTALFDALDGFHRTHPGVEITLIEDSSDRLTQRVRAGTSDLALIGSTERLPGDLAALPIARERLVAAVPPAHPLAGQPRVPLAGLAGYPIVCMPEGAGIRAVLDQAAAAAGLTLHIALEASAPGVVAGLAARGLGVAVLSESMAAGQRGRLTALPIDGAGGPALLALIWRPAASPVVTAFLRHCRQAFGLPGG